MLNVLSAEKMQIIDLLEQFENPDYEPFYKEYKQHLDNITKILSKFDLVEGNVFGHHGTDATTYPRTEFRSKRRLLSLLALSKKNILEVGFNAGHSALLLLTANPDLKYTAIDLNFNPYVIECFDYLKSVFGDRICLQVGDSQIELPKLLDKNSSFDGYIIDGGHSIPVAQSDLLNIIKYAGNDAVICFDDSDSPKLRALLNYHILSGTLFPILDNKDQMFFRLLK